MASHEIFVKQSDGSVSKKIFTAPVGSVIAYPVDSVPDHCMECNGAVISRAAYPELFSVLGTVYGAGDGSSTFNLPDFRDRFLRGAGGENAAAIGAAQNAQIGTHLHSMRTYLNPTSGSGSGIQNIGIGGASGPYYVASEAYGGHETRPANYAVRYCIIFE